MQFLAVLVAVLGVASAGVARPDFSHDVVSGSPLVQLIFNVNAESQTIEASPVVVPATVEEAETIVPSPVSVIEGAAIPPSPVSVIEEAVIPPTPVSVIEEAVLPSPVSVIDQPAIVDPVSVIEQPTDVNPIDIISPVPAVVGGTDTGIIV